MTPSATAVARSAFDVQKVRADFPILSERVHGKPLVYLDSANTSQKPLAVIEAMDAYYRHANANIHRATHLLSERATALYEGARIKAAAFLNAPDPRSIVLTKGTTDGINLVAQSYGRSTLRAGDEIVISWLEHHSNIVPWQMLCEQTGAVLRVVPINTRGEVEMDAYAALLSSRTRIVAMGHVSNALGTINPVREVVEQAHARGAVVLIDGAQAAPHLAIDVQALDCDFYVLSSHKMFGPTGVGVLYGRPALLEHRVGEGRWILCTYPLEHMAAQTMAVNPEPTWRIYSALADVAGVTPDVSVADPRVVVGELVHEDGRRFVWFINMVDTSLRCEPRLRSGVLHSLDGAREPIGNSLEFPPFGVHVLELTAGG